MDKFADISNDELIITPMGSRSWRLKKSYFFYFDKSDKQRGVIIPVGFVTDFASVPRLFWSLISPTGRHSKASVLHDYLYYDGYNLGISRYEADKFFLTALRVSGVKVIKRNLMFLAVRIFGFTRYTREN